MQQPNEQSDDADRIREVAAKAVDNFGDVLGGGGSNLALLLKKCANEYAADIRSGKVKV